MNHRCAWTLHSLVFESTEEFCAGVATERAPADVQVRHVGDLEIVQGTTLEGHRGVPTGRAGVHSELTPDGDFLWGAARDRRWGALRVNAGADLVQWSTSDRVARSDVRAALCGPIMGAILARRGLLALHATTVAFEGEAIMLVGDKHAGKSTTAAALCDAGACVVAEDISVAQRRGDDIFVRRGSQRLRLDRTSPGAIGRPRHGLVLQHGDKEYVDVPGIADAEARLAMVVFLGPRVAHDRSAAFDRLTAAAATAGLMRGRYGHDELLAPIANVHFTESAFIADQLECLRIALPNSIEHLRDALGPLVSRLRPAR